MNNFDRDKIMNNHVKQLKRAFGNNGDMTTRYEWITSQNELVDSYLHRMSDLGYPLRVEPKRDRYVLNRKGLEKAIEKVVEETLNQMQKEIEIWIQTGVVPMIEDSVQDVLDEINVVSNNLVVQRSKSFKMPQKSNLAKFAERLTKAIVKTVGDIIEDEIIPKEKR